MNFKQALAQAASSGSFSPAEKAEILAIAEGASVRRAAALENFSAHALGASGAIDWANLISQLQTLLPLILQIVALFKK